MEVPFIEIKQIGGLVGEASHRASHLLYEGACAYLRRLLHFQSHLTLHHSRNSDRRYRIAMLSLSME